MHEARFQTLYLSSRGRLWAYVFRITGERALTDDLTQESFCRIYQVPDSELTEGAERAYLFRIATNLANDHFRRNSRVRGYLASLLGGRAKSEDPRAAHEMQSLFERLRPRERALLWLAHVEGYSHQEIAAILGLKPASIRVLLSRARKRLATIIQSSERPAHEELAPATSAGLLGSSLNLEGMKKLHPGGLP